MTERRTTAGDAARNGRFLGEPADTGHEIREFVRALRRRWWIIAISLVVVVGFTKWRQRRDVPQYLAETVIQKMTNRSPLEMVGLGSGLSNGSLMSELEVLRSRAVLDDVVDSLGLRAVIPGPASARRAIEDLQILPEARVGRYELRRQNDTIVLVSADDVVLDRAPLAEWIEGPGFRLRTRVGPPPPELLALVIVFPEEAVDQLRRGVRADVVPNTDLIRIRYSHADPERAARTVNVLAEVFRRHSARQAREAASRRRLFIAQQLSEVSDSLAVAQQLVLDFQQSSQTVNPETASRVVSERLLQEEDELRNLRYREEALQELIENLRTGGESRETFYRMFALGSEIFTGAQAMYERLRSLEQDRAGMTASRFGFREQRPEVQRQDSLIASTKAEIRGVAEQSLSVLRERIAVAEGRVDDLREESGDLPGRVTNLARLTQKVSAVQSLYDLLLEKQYEAQIAEAVEAGDVEVVDPAPVPLRPEPLNHGRQIAFSFVLSLLIGVGAALLVERLDTRVRTASQAELVSGLGIVGSIPSMTSGRGGLVGPVMLNGDGTSVGIEAFRMLRTNIRFARADPPRSIMLTSGEPGEGKSTLALNLAAALAQQTSNVLLIDGDLRRPMIHATLKLGRHPGLTDVLVGACSLREAMKRVTLPGTGSTLMVLTAGSPTPNPAELLGSSSFTKLIEYAEEHFDAVIVDAPPVLAVTDPVLIAEAVAGALVVARPNVTDQYNLARAVRQLESARANLLGVVLNGVPRGSEYRYAYYEYPNKRRS